MSNPLVSQKDTWHFLYFFMMQRLPHNTVIADLALYYIVSRCTQNTRIFLNEASKCVSKEDLTGVILILHSHLTAAARNVCVFYADTLNFVAKDDPFYHDACSETVRLLEFLCQ